VICSSLCVAVVEHLREKLWAVCAEAQSSVSCEAETGRQLIRPRQAQRQQHVTASSSALALLDRERRVHDWPFIQNLQT
jgi:hypothetical protein